MTQITQARGKPLTRADAVSRRGVLAGAAGLAAFPLLSRAVQRDDRATSTAAAPTPRTAPTLPNGSGYYRFKVGSLECIAIGDSQSAMPAHPCWGGEGDKAAVEALLAKHHRATDMASLYFQPLVLRAGKDTILIDTGNGPTDGKLIPHLANAGIAPTDITIVVLTHLHGDHVKGLRDASGNAAFPNARYAVQRAELDFWSGTPDFSKTPLLPEGFKQSAVQTGRDTAGFVDSKLERLKDGVQIVEGVKVLLAPGHTPGLQMLEITSGSERMVVANDIIHHETLSLRRPDLHVFFDTDVEQGAKTRARTLDMLASDGALVFSYHMPFPAVGRIVRDGAAYAWSPEPWKW